VITMYLYPFSVRMYIIIILSYSNSYIVVMLSVHTEDISELCMYVTVASSYPSG